MSNWTVTNQYFNLLNKTVEDLGLKDKPSQIFNCDESGFSGKEKCRKKVLVGKGTHAYQQSNLGHSHCTAHVCVAADDRVLPTCIIFEGGLPHRNFTDGIPPSWLARFSSCGSIIFFCRTAEVGDQFFSSSTTTIPISHCPFLKAMANDVHVMGLLPHTTHILQPLDVSIFGPLKQKVASLAASVGYVNPNVIIGNAMFPMPLRYSITNI
uniref:DDE-1 domain-containing protein n=1 Tax=Magallana gigas TaxID=29159 RepID=A0A8W8LM17_MAGGI